MPTPNKYAHWRNLLSSNRISQALEELRAVFAQSDRLKEIIQQSGRHAALSTQIRSGTINLEDRTVLENQIRLGVIALLEDIERWEQEDETLGKDLAPVTIKITGSVSKAVIKSSITAGGNVHIGDIYYGTEPIPHFLTAQPQNPPVFKGRDEQLKELHEKLFHGTGDHVLLLVNGQGGVGKTSLANRYFFDYHDRYHHAAWVLKDGSIRDALLSLERGLNLQFRTETNEQRLAIILQKVANLKAPCLLIIDNANKRDDLVQHIGALRQCANFHVLLTSRLDYFDGAKTYKVGALPLPVAKDLFEQYYRPLNAEESALFPDVYTAVDGNTLVLQLLAKNLKKNRRQYHLPDLLADLRERGVLDLSRSRKVVTDYGNFNEGQIEHIVAAMFDLGDLDEPQLALLSVFAALPPEKIPYTHLEVLVTFLDDLDETLDQLQQLGWLEENENDGRSSYRCSPVVQAVVKKKQENWLSLTPLLRTEINKQLATYDGGNLKIGIKAALPFVIYGEAITNDLPKERENLYFYQQLAHFYNSSGDLRTNMEWVKRMVSLMKELLAENENDPDLKNGLAISCEKMGIIFRSFGNLPKALEFFEERARLTQELYTTYLDNVEFKDGLAIAFKMLGETYIAFGNLTKALEFFEGYTTQMQELHATYPNKVSFKNGLAVSYEKLGETYRALGNLSQALKFSEIRSRLSQEIHEAYPDNVGFKNGLAVAYETLGSTHAALGNQFNALEFNEKRAKLCQELHAAYPDNVGFKNGLALSYGKLGETHKALENFPKAFELFNIATNLFDELYTAYPDQVRFKNSLATSYSKLGITHSSIGNLYQSLGFFEKRLRLSQELHATYPEQVAFKNGFSISYLNLGETHNWLGESTKALDFFKQFHSLQKELHYAYPDNVAFKNGLAVSYMKLGEVARENTHKRTHYQKAEQLWVELTEASPDYAQFQKFLGLIQERLADL